MAWAWLSFSFEHHRLDGTLRKVAGRMNPGLCDGGLLDEVPTA
jgi:hypothetical protein